MRESIDYNFNPDNIKIDGVVKSPIYCVVVFSIEKQIDLMIAYFFIILLILTNQLFSGFYIFLETISKYFRVDRREICFLKYIFEAYDGIASLTTIDSSSGCVVLHISPGCENDVEMLLEQLKKEIMIEPGVSKESVG